MTDTIALSFDAGIARIRFNRPAALNAADEALAAAFLDACRSLSARVDVRAVVLSGTGKGFMAGGDVAGMHAALPDADRFIAALLDSIHPALVLLTEMDAPVIASLHGPVAGAGASIALAADLAIAADDTKLNLAYTRIGGTPDAGSTWTLPRLVGLRRAMEIALLSDAYGAEDALRLGLVNWVVPRAELETATDVLARRIAAGPTRSYGAVKQLLRDSFERTFAQHLDAERDAFLRAARGEDFREGITAFVEKRQPSFSGR